MDILLDGYCRENILDGIIILQEIYIMQFLNTNVNDTISDAGKLYICILQNAKECPPLNKSVAKVGTESSRGGPREGVETCT